MTKRILIGALIPLLFLFDCGEEKMKSTVPPLTAPPLTEAEMQRLVLLDTSYVYPLETAKEQALQLSSQFLNRDGVARSISHVLTVPSLYSLEGKTQIKTDFAIAKPKTPSTYVVNFREKKGYVILSADKRASEILAIVGSGTIDSVTHIGLRVFLSNAIFHVDEKVAELESKRGDKDFTSMVDKLHQAFVSEAGKKSQTNSRTSACLSVLVPGGTLGGCTDPCYYITSTVPIQTINTTTYIAQPLLKTRWDQSSPYNNGQPDGGCPYRSDNCGNFGKYLAGCVPIAEGQVVAFYNAKKLPLWQSITSKLCKDYTSEETNLVSNMVHSIFLMYGPYVSRSCDGTGAGANFGDLHLTNPMGISPGYGLVQGEWRGWNTTDIRNSLAGGSPVVIQGMQHLFCLIYCVGSGSGHEWVIDGMRDLGIQTTYQFTAYYQGTGCLSTQLNYRQSYTYAAQSTTATQIHQNWGWGPYTGGEPNDWYAQDVFQSSYQSPGWDNNYNHANYIVAYITPR